MNYPDQIADFCEAVVPVGSRVTCNPPPMDTDQDLLCLLADEDYDQFSAWLSKRGWTFEDEYGMMTGEFDSARKEHWNLILTSDVGFFDKFIDATRSCKEKNLLDKKERIKEFEKVFGKADPIKSWPPKQIDLDTLVYQQDIQINPVHVYDHPAPINWAVHYQNLFAQVQTAPTEF